MVRPSDNIAVCSPNTGLCGPFLFPFRWTFERKRGRKSARRTAHRRQPAVRGKPLFVEAGPLPVKALRHLLQRLAARMDEHRSLDIGESFFDVFPAYPDNTEEALVDFLADGTSIARDGSRMLVEQLRQWFHLSWAKLQERAVISGHYFPPPCVLRARLTRAGDVRIEAGFAPGFVPFDHLLTGFLPAGARSLGTLWLLDPDEPIPSTPNRKDFLRACALRLARPGEDVAHIGTVFDHEFNAQVASRIRIGDEVCLEAPPPDWYWAADRPYHRAVYWQGHCLGTTHILDETLRARLSRDATLAARVIRLGTLMRPDWGRIVYAVYDRSGNAYAKPSPAAAGGKR